MPSKWSAEKKIKQLCMTEKEIKNMWSENKQLPGYPRKLWQIRKEKQNEQEKTTK